MTGRIAAALVVLAAVLGGGAMYYLQVYAYYERSEGGEVALTLADGEPAIVPVTDASAIDADSSPLRYRACFREALDPAAFEPYPAAEPTVGPRWFGCYDAGEATRAIEEGAAAPVLGTANLTYGVDRVAALFADGRGMMWHQLNPCGAAVYAGREPPAGCPPPPEAYRD